MANFISGKAGKVTVSSERTDISAWKLDRNVDSLDATSFSSGGNKEYVAGLFGSSGTFRSGKYHALLSGSLVAATFATGATATASAPSFAGSILIKGEPVDCPVDGVVSYEYAFDVSGALTAATA